MQKDRADRPQGAVASRVEIGWLLSGTWKRESRQAASDAAERMRARLAALLPDFDWQVNVVVRADAPQDGRAEPVLLLDAAEIERDRHGWDFVFVLTPLDLIGYSRPSAIAATSRVFAAAMISTARLTEDRAGADVLGERLFSLAMHLFGRLNGLEPTDEDGFMRDFDVARSLDRMQGFGSGELERLHEQLLDVADLRVEEMQGEKPNPLIFYLRSFWENRRALPRAILRMRPWSFPARLSRLTTAAGSALAVLMMTAESWEVASNLPPATVAGLSLGALVATSAYLIRAQRLLARPGERVLSEQRAVSNIGTVLAVGIGMAVTYLAIFAIAWLAGAVLFGDALLARWVGADVFAALPLRAHMSGFTAALSLVIGALGASFEPHGYFRHVTYIDDEL